MNAIALIGSPDRTEEFLQTTGVTPDYVGALPPAIRALSGFDLILDLNLDDFPERMKLYAGLAEATVVGCAVKKSLLQMVQLSGAMPDCILLGINALPGFLQRKVWEMSALRADNQGNISSYLKSFGVESVTVTDQVGMATPRVLFSIINESYLMVQQGIVSGPELDQAMQLGVNYPHGPIAWGRKIGLKNIVETLDAMLAVTADPRYRVAESLRKEALFS